MLEIVVGRNKKNMLAQEALIKAVRGAKLTGTLYLGYPIIATADQMVTIDAVLTSSEHGIVAIDFLRSGAHASVDQVRESQDDAYNAVFRKLLDFKPLVRSWRLQAIRQQESLQSNCAHPKIFQGSDVVRL